MFNDAPLASLPPRGRELERGGAASVVAGIPLPAVVVGVAVVAIGLLTAIARSTFGWEVAVALHLPTGLQAPVQWLLAVACGAGGAALGRRALEHARGDRLGGVVGSSLNGLGAGVALFVAIELARAAM
jgi:hypothetical protein